MHSVSWIHARAGGWVCEAVHRSVGRSIGAGWRGWPMALFPLAPCCTASGWAAPPRTVRRGRLLRRAEDPSEVGRAVQLLPVHSTRLTALTRQYYVPCTVHSTYS